MLKISILAFLTSTFLICGCKTNPIKDPKFQPTEQNGQQQQSPGFNQEHYIWETWLFPTPK